MNIYKCVLLLFLAFSPSVVFCKGKLVEICGIDGSGKTTLARSLQKKMVENGLKVSVLKPSHGDDFFYPFLNEIRKMGEGDLKLKSAISAFIDSYFSLYLLTQKSRIEEALEKNDFVILDRYICSHQACQLAFGKQSDGFDLAFQNLPQADYTCLLSLSPALAVERIASRGLPRESYENETFLTDLQAVFSHMDFASVKGRVIHKSGEVPPEDLALEVFELIYE